MLKLQGQFLVELRQHRLILCALRGNVHEGGGGATSQLDLLSQKPLSVAGCGQLQLGIPHWAT